MKILKFVLSGLLAMMLLALDVYASPYSCDGFPQVGDTVLFADGFSGQVKSIGNDNYHIQVEKDLADDGWDSVPKTKLFLPTYLGPNQCIKLDDAQYCYDSILTTRRINQKVRVVGVNPVQKDFWLNMNINLYQKTQVTNT